MTAKEILDSLKLISPTPEKLAAHSQLAMDLQLIEKEVPDQLDRIYFHMEQGNMALAFGSIKACSGEIKACLNSTKMT